MGIPNPKPDKVTVTSLGEDLVLYIKIPELTPLIGAQTADASVAPTTYQQNVDGHNRRRYSGGPVTGVAGHLRNRTKGGEGGKAVLPGNNAWLERDPVVPGESKRVEQITYVGTFAQLKAFCRAKATTEFVLRSPWGEPFPIDPKP
jgi:hypothetical protein